MNKVAIISQSGNESSLSGSYLKSVVHHNLECKSFKFQKYLSKYSKFGKFGKKLYAHIKVETWEKQANRDIAIDIKDYQPDLIIMMGKTQILPGTIAFLKSIMETKVVMIWMDPLYNLNNDTLRLAPLTDLFASFSSSAIPSLKKLGFRDSLWVPLAADSEMHKIRSSPKDFLYDISFIGGWRPEREEYLIEVIKHFSNYKIKIQGTNWERAKESRLLKKYVTNEPILGNQYAKFLNNSRINLNIIDFTGFPAANMRFFEIPIASGLQLSSSCPEQESVYKEGEHILYFKDKNEFLKKIDYVLNKPNDAQKIRENAFNLTLESQTYHHRLKQIINYINGN